MPKDPTGEFAAPAISATVPQTGFFGHPRGLATLFLTEFWERFSYYGMRALLILYMTAAIASGGLAFDAERAGAIYGLYAGSVYLLALPGGWIADRLLGQRRSVMVGGIIIAMGHFSLAFKSTDMFFLGLMLIAVGTGFLKPNISTMVGELYAPGDRRRDAGFSIFYMGINLGAVAAPLLVGWIGERVGWHYGFALAGFGMVAGVIQYALGGRHLGEAGLHPTASQTPQARKSAALIASLVGGLIVAAIALIWTGVLVIPVEKLASGSAVVIAGLAIFYLLYQLVAGGLNPVEKRQMIVIFVLFLFSALFWSGFEQAGSSFNLFAERLTQRTVFGWEIPATLFQVINPLIIVILAPLFASLWIWLGQRGKEPSSPAKFSFGLILLGLGFAVLSWGSIYTAGGKVPVSLMWLVTTYVLHSCGELCLSPVGLSTVTKLAPHRKVSQMMGIWFISISLGNLFAGLVAGKFETLPLPQLFGAVCATTVVAGLVMALIVKPVRRLMGGVN